MGFSIHKKAKKVVFVINSPNEADDFDPSFYTSLVSWALEHCVTFTITKDSKEYPIFVSICKGGNK